MKKKILGILFLTVLILTITIKSSLAYSDEFFEFDLPESYGNLSYQNNYVFSDTNNKGRGMVIHIEEDRQIKKSVWDIDKSDLDRVIRSLTLSSNILKTDRKAKLGKEKAVEVIISDDGDYIDLYILASNKYIYVVMFTADTQEELDNTDYKQIKKSFKLKDATTNFRVLYIIVVIIVIGISAYLKYRRANKY